MTSPPRSDRFELTVDDVRELLTELGSRLQDDGVEATLYIAGGVAMAVEFDARRVTKDVDAVFHPRSTVQEAAVAIAADRGLPPDWLNDGVRAWIPGDDGERVPFDVPGLTVALASPRHLLAMKMAAFRPVDKADLAVLFDHLGIETPEEAADIAVEVYGEHAHALPSREELVLEAESILARRRRGRPTEERPGQ